MHRSSLFNMSINEAEEEAGNGPTHSCKSEQKSRTSVRLSKRLYP